MYIYIYVYTEAETTITLFRYVKLTDDMCNKTPDLQNVDGHNGGKWVIHINMHIQRKTYESLL